VDDNSASLGVRNENLGWIPAKHIDMCKFSSREDIGYRHVSLAIKNLVKDVLKQRLDLGVADPNGAQVSRSRQVGALPERPKELFLADNP
jgi:hypothetical protein